MGKLRTGQKEPLFEARPGTLITVPKDTRTKTYSRGEKMANKYGYSLDKWNKTKEEMRQILIDMVRIPKYISYSELVGKVKTIILQPESYALAAMLGEISSEEDAAKRGMLSVIVVHKSGDGRPGSGFFELAEDLGHDISDRDKFWVDEWNKVISYWKNNNG